MATFKVPLPPPTNSGYKIGTRWHRKQQRWVARMMKTDKLLAWEWEVAEIIGDWQPKPKTPLTVKIILAMPKEDLRRKDIDGMHKYLIDQIVGKRRDQWIDHLEVTKLVGDGWAQVTVDWPELAH